jgi:ribosome-associated toxin RatA of RatAB toxin-antitoxin module
VRSLPPLALLALFALWIAAVFGARAASGAEDIRTWTEPANAAGAPTYCAEGIVAAPPAAVWALVSHCADYVQNMPSIAASKELSRSGDEHATFTATCEVTADVPFPFSDLTSVSRATMTADTHSGAYSRTWTMIRGDYDVNEGSWQLVPVEGGAKTKVTYRITVLPKTPLPTSLITASQNIMLPQVIQRLRDRTASAR